MLIYWFDNELLVFSSIFFQSEGWVGNSTHEGTSYIVNKLINNEKEMIDKDVSLDELSY